MELETINKLYLELSQITTATTAREILLQKQLAEAQDALQAAQRLFKEALPKFNWGASFLDANAIQLLNEVPAKVDAAIATYLQTLAVTTPPKVSNES